MRKQTNRFSSMQYKKGGEKQDWISNKISTLLEEDPKMSQKQAIAIALSMSEKQFQDGGTPKKPLFGAESMFPISRVDKNVNGDYTINYTNSQIEPVTYSKEDFEAKLKLTQPSADAPGQYDPYLLKYIGKTQGRTGQTVTYQNGGNFDFSSTPNFGTIEQPKVQGFGFDPNYQNQLSTTSITAGEDFKKANPLPPGTFEADPFGVSSNKELNTPKKTTEDFQPMQFFNPYAGVDLAQGANALGQSIENGDALGIVAGGAKVLAGTARNIFGGMGQANVRNEGIKNYMDAQRDNIVGKSQQGTPSFQEGGEQQGQAEQIYQMVAEALQSGADPQEIAQQLTQMGLSEQEVMQIIQEVMSQMQGQQSVQNEVPQEQPQMKMGGSFMDEIVGKKILGYKYNKDKDSYTLNYE